MESKKTKRDKTDEETAGRRLSSVEIARLAGVARSTVSKVLNGYPNISQETRDRVLEKVKQHQYYPNLSAQILAGKRTDTLGLFFVSRGHFSEDILVNFMISRVIECAASLGYHILTYITRDPVDSNVSDSIREVFHQRRVDGGIFIGARNGEAVIDELVSEGFVVGVLDQSSRGRTEPNRIIVNFADEKTASSVIDYLVSLGHEQIAIIHGDLNRNAGRAKQRGFIRGLKRNGVRINEDWQARSDFTSDGGYRCMMELIEKVGFREGRRMARRRLPTAVACANDSVAFGVMRALVEEDVSVPDKVSVVGIDGHPFGEHVRPALTTFQFDFSAMMHSLIEGVIGAIEDRASELERTRVFSATLVERNSCRKLEYP